MTSSRISKPSDVYSTIKGYVDDVAHFDEAKIDTTTVSADQIAVRELRMAVPASTTPLQWAEIARAMEYGKSQGVAVIVTGVK